MKHGFLFLAWGVLLLSSCLTNSSQEWANRCKGRICNKLPNFTQMLVGRFDKRIVARERRVSSHSRSCLNSSQSLGTSLLITKNDSDAQAWSSEITRQIWLTGACAGNISIFLAANPTLNCSLEKLNVASLHEKSNFTRLPTRIEVMKFAECVTSLFFHGVTYDPAWSANLCFDKYKHVCSLREPRNATTKGETEEYSGTESTLEILNITRSIFHTSNESDGGRIEPNLQKHHGHGGNVPVMIITLVCTLCGGSCLTFLLCFNRVRHLFCSCCGICRDVNRYSRLFNDD